MAVFSAFSRQIGIRVAQYHICPCITFRNFHSLFQITPHQYDVKTFSRKRNIFVDPPKEGPGGDKLNELANLYDSGRFNDDDENETSMSVAEMNEEQNDNDDDAPSKSTKNKARGIRDVKVKTAEFLKSSVDVKHCPAAVYPEFAVIGRSNVGKSSLINMMTGRNALAMVSKTPGKTRCINHFLINRSWYLVDLPGYGYARVSKDNIAGWNKFTRDYFLERENLAAVFLLVDASIPPLELDINCAAWLVEAQVPFVIVFTKLDKRKKGVPPAEENMASFEAMLQEKYEDLPPIIATSSKTRKGKGELLTLIAQIRSQYNASR